MSRGTYHEVSYAVTRSCLHLSGVCPNGHIFDSNVLLASVRKWLCQDQDAF